MEGSFISLTRVGNEDEEDCFWGSKNDKSEFETMLTCLKAYPQCPEACYRDMPGTIGQDSESTKLLRLKLLFFSPSIL